MSQTIPLKLSDDLYAALLRVAQGQAQSPSEWPSVSGAGAPGLGSTEEAAAFEADWQAYLAEIAAERNRPPPSAEAAAAEVQDILARWRGKPVREAEAIALAMSAAICTLDWIDVMLLSSTPTQDSNTDE